MTTADPLASLLPAIQEAGSQVAAALHVCHELEGGGAIPPGPAGDGLAGDLAAIRANLLDAARLLDRAERLAYPVP